MTVITISRQFGSGGNEIARRISATLGYRHFDKLMMAKVAAEVGISEKELVDFSEDTYKMQGYLSRLLGERLSSAISAAEVDRLDADYSLNLTQSVVNAAYERGNTVIVGRGGQAILRGKPDVLHVRIVAPYDFRMQRLEELHNYSLGGAKDAAIKHDRASAEYLKRFYNVDWSDPLLYDLVINTGQLGLNLAVHLVVSAVGHLHPAEATPFR